GRVVEGRNPAMIRGGLKNRAAVRTALDRGLIALTGTDHPVEAWRTFVQPGEAVGIKVVPNGHPGAPTSPELIVEVIDGLRSAGNKLNDIGGFYPHRLPFPEAPHPKSPPPRALSGALTPVA